jgi:hypothetical protein
MEGIGAGDSVTPHLRSAAPRAVAERLQDDENSSGDGGGGSEAEKRHAREFERSEQRFDRRKEEIEQIMAKGERRFRFFFKVPFELMWGAARSWMRSRRHPRRFERSTRRCSMPWQPYRGQNRGMHHACPFLPLHVALTYIASLCGMVYEVAVKSQVLNDVSCVHLPLPSTSLGANPSPERASTDVLLHDLQLAI